MHCKILSALLLWISVAAHANEISVATKYDGYEKATGIATEKYGIPKVGSFLSPAFAFAHLAGKVTDVGTATMYLRVYYDGHGWRFFDSAKDSEGNSIAVGIVDRRVNYGDNINEEFVANLTHDYLIKHEVSGLNIRFSGKYGELIVRLPPEYITAFLSKVAEVEGNVRAGLSAPSSQLVGKVKLGVQYFPVTEDFIKRTNLPKIQGVVIGSVAPGGAADRSGLLPGDAVLTFGGCPVEPTFVGLSSLVSQTSPGSTVEIVVWRSGEEKKIVLKF